MSSSGPIRFQVYLPAITGGADYRRDDGERRTDGGTFCPNQTNKRRRASYPVYCIYIYIQKKKNNSVGGGNGSSLVMVVEENL